MSPEAAPTHPLVIVGGGPAGIAAATAAASAGLRCTLIDEGERLGGQIYRQPPQAFHAGPGGGASKDESRGARLLADLDRVADRIELMSQTSVLGIWGKTLLLATRDGWTQDVAAERIVLATGARDRSVPFPGWTLPGVMTAGGAQTLMKSMRVRPGNRAVVAGTGPLLLVVANQLHAAGVDVVAVLEAGRPQFTFGAFARVWKEWGLLADAWRYWRGLKRAGIPVLFHHTVFAATGKDGVESVTYGPVSPDDWRPVREAAVTVEADLLVVGFGFVPNGELAAIAGCEHRYRHELGGFVPVRDACCRTSAPGVFAAGDGAGVAGALVAVEEGCLAGITAAEEAGVLAAKEADRRRRRPLARLRSLARVREVLDEISRIRPGLSDLAAPETLLCRCEEVTRAQVESALAEGAKDLQAVKLLTRLGMGPCQGRNCEASTAMLICGRTGGTPEDVGTIHPRPPVKPVTLGALARCAAGPSVPASTTGGLA